MQHRFVPLLLFCLSAMVTVRAPAASPGTGEILSRSKRAAGGIAWHDARSLRMKGTIKAGGLDGTLESLVDLVGGRYLTRYDLGVAKGTEAFDGDRVWSQDSSGDVAVKDSRADLESARNEAYRTARAWWFPARWQAQIRFARETTEPRLGFQVCRITPKGGRPFDLWLDDATLLPSRIVEKTATATETTLLSDYRKVEGILVPFRVDSSRGTPGTDVHVAWSSIELNAPYDDTDFSPPEAAVEDFTITEGRCSVSMPFQLANNHIYLMGSVNGSPPRRFLMDTGGMNLLTRKAAADLSLAVAGEFQAGGAGEGSTRVGMTKLDRFELGGVKLMSPLFAVIPLPSIVQAEGVEFSGIIGYETFRRFVVTIDYASKTVTLTRPEAYKLSPGTRIPFRLDDRTPIVDGSFDGIGGVFSIDTGSRSTLDLHAPFVAQHNLMERLAPKLKAMTGFGVGGAVHSWLSPAHRLTLGPMVIPSVLTQLTAQKKGAFTNRYLAGNVGAGVLKRFTVTFHYREKFLHLAKNATFDLPDRFDRSGMWLNAVDGAFQVEEVVPEGPAREAGLSPEDRIVAVDGQPVSSLSLPALRERLRKEPVGTTIRLSIKSRNGTLEKRLVLRDLL